MRRFALVLCAVGGMLLVPFLSGGLHRAVADADGNQLVPGVEVFAGEVSVAATGGVEAADQHENTFAVADEDRDDARDGARGERRRSRHHHGPHDGHHHHGPPAHDMHGHRGPPPGFHHAMRRFDEIIERLAKIESKLGIDDPAPARRERWPQPDDRDGDRGGSGPYRPGGPWPKEMGRQREERGAEIRQRMEDARRRFREMEERVKTLEAEIERMKAADRGP
jgi:hypothetical protein